MPREISVHDIFRRGIKASIEHTRLLLPLPIASLRRTQKHHDVAIAIVI